MCMIDREGQVKDCDACSEYCEKTEDCSECAIQKCFDRLAKYENAHEQIEKRVEELKSSNHSNQTVKELEWVLGLLNENRS